MSAARSARQRSFSTVAPSALKKSAVHPPADPTGQCRCDEKSLSSFCQVKGEIDFHECFRQCSECGQEPAQYLCATTFKGFCEKHARAHYQAVPAHHIMVNYEIWQYERCFWCFKCSGFCMNEAFDNVLEPLFSSKGSFCPRPIRAKHSDKFEHRGIRAGTSTAQGWRSDNEDSHVVFMELPNSKSDLFSVFDGHGGPLVARFLGQTVHKIFDTSFKALEGAPDAAEKALQRTFLAADEALASEAGEDCGTCGSTACVVALIHEPKKRIVCANAGDTRAVLCRAGKAFPLSHDHRPVIESERKRVVSAGSAVIDERVDGMLAVSRALGDYEFKQARGLPPQAQAVTCFPEVIATDFTAEDRFLIVACDGIWDCVTSEEAVTFVSKALDAGNDPMSIADALIDKCIANDIPEDGIGTDNMSVIIVRFA